MLFVFLLPGYFDFDAYSLMVFAPQLEILPYLNFFFLRSIYQDSWIHTLIRFGITVNSLFVFNFVIDDLHFSMKF